MNDLKQDYLEYFEKASTFMHCAKDLNVNGKPNAAKAYYSQAINYFLMAENVAKGIPDKTKQEVAHGHKDEALSRLQSIVQEIELIK